jgi:MFS transporter, UMF1 family
MPNIFRSSILARLGLDRPELRAWAMYDWAISAVQTTTTVAVFPAYFGEVAKGQLGEGGASQALSDTHILIALVVALASPILGALSDIAAAKKRLLALVMAPGVLAVAAMFGTFPGEVTEALTLFAVALISATACTIFYAALLPHIAAPGEIDRVSSAGYALGYLGGGILLALNLAWILAPGVFGLPDGDGLSTGDATLPVRLALVSVAVWWVVFSIPLFRRVPEPPRVREPDEGERVNLLVTSFKRIGETYRELRRFRHAFLMLIAFMIYNDGIGTIQRLASVYGTEQGIGRTDLIGAFLLVQFLGVPFAFLFGALAGKIGAKRGVMLGLAVFLAISIFAGFVRTAWHFWLLAFFTGLVQGGTQALSRSLFASMIPAHKSGEFFGLYSVFEKFASIFGPLLFSYSIRMTGKSELAIMSIAIFFVVGMVVLSRVNVDEGRRVAREAEQDVRLSGLPVAPPAVA